MRRRIRNIIYVVLAILSLIVGAIGVVLPILPTTPFLLASSFLFARGSKRFNRWFISTKLYEDHVEDFIETRSMTLKNKVKILAFASTMLLVSMYIADNIYARLGISCLIIYKYYYFFFNIETIDEENTIAQIESRKIQEKKVVTKMIEIYCRGNKHAEDIPCSRCRELIGYANDRVDNCPHTEAKTFCSNCDIHCYKPVMKERIKSVMRYSGPRMILHNPIIAIQHAMETVKTKLIS